MKNERDSILLETWFKKYGPYLFRNAYLYFKNKETAEEVVQETFRAVSGKENLEDVKFPRKWLSDIMKNEIGNLLKRRKKEQALAEKLRLALGSEEDLVSENEVNLMIDYHGLIPAEDLRLVILVGVQRLTYKEAAEIMGITEEACRKRYDRSIKKLREKLMVCQK